MSVAGASDLVGGSVRGERYFGGFHQKTALLRGDRRDTVIDGSSVYANGKHGRFPTLL